MSDTFFVPASIVRAPASVINYILPLSPVSAPLAGPIGSGWP